MEFLNKLNFDIQPVAFKFFAQKPEGIDRLDKKIGLCEMLKEAQEGKSFYADPENHDCFPALFAIEGISIEFGT